MIFNLKNKKKIQKFKNFLFYSELNKFRPIEKPLNFPTFTHTTKKNTLLVKKKEEE
jgi:hypothetical protein